MEYDDIHVGSEFKLRNPIPNPYLNHDALSELGLSALEAGRGARGALGEHMFSIANKLEPSATNIVFLYMYMYGVLCPADLTYYFGVPNKLITLYICRLKKRGLCKKLELPKNSNVKSFRSDAFYIADTRSDVAKYLKECGIEPGIEDVTPRAVSHSYGVALSAMMVNLFCHIRDGLGVKRTIFEPTLSITNKKSYMQSKSGGRITIDAVMDISLPCKDMNRTLNIEFDTGSEGYATIADKFVDYMDTPVYTNKTEGGALYLQTILFSYNDITVKANTLKMIEPVERYLSFFVKACIYAAFKLGCVEMSFGDSADRVLLYNISSLFEGDAIVAFNNEYSDISEKFPSSPRIWATSLIVEYFPAVGSYIAQSGIGFDFISELIDSEARITRATAQSFFELSDFCSGTLVAAGEIFTINNMKDVLLSILSNVKNGALSCSEPSMLIRAAYNRAQYDKAFTRHIGTARKCLEYAEGQVKLGSDGRLRADGEPNYVRMIAISPMYSGYQVYFAATHLLNNHLSSIIYKDKYGFTGDPSILYMLSYLESKFVGLDRDTLSPDLCLDGQLGTGRMRDVLIDEAYGYVYSVVDASIETSALVRTAILHRHYSPTLPGNDGLHLVTIMLVRSFDEIRDITKSVFKGALKYLYDEQSFTIFALHPSLSFGFEHSNPKFYSCQADGKIIDANIF